MLQKELKIYLQTFHGGETNTVCCRRIPKAHPKKEGVLLVFVRHTALLNPTK